MMVPPIRWMVGMAARPCHTSVAPRGLVRFLAVGWPRAEGFQAAGVLGGAFHDRGRRRAKHCGPRLGMAAEAGVFARRARHDEGRAERALVGGLAVALIGHEL